MFYLDSLKNVKAMPMSTKVAWAGSYRKRTAGRGESLVCREEKRERKETWAKLVADLVLVLVCLVWQTNTLRTLLLFSYWACTEMERWEGGGVCDCLSVTVWWAANMLLIRETIWDNLSTIILRLFSTLYFFLFWGTKSNQKIHFQFLLFYFLQTKNANKSKHVKPAVYVLTTAALKHFLPGKIDGTKCWPSVHLSSSPVRPSWLHSSLLLELTFITQNMDEPISARGREFKFIIHQALAGP